MLKKLSLAVTALGTIAGCNTTTQTIPSITQADPNILATFGDASGIRKEAIVLDDPMRVIALVDNVSTTRISDVAGYELNRGVGTPHHGGNLYVTS